MLTRVYFFEKFRPFFFKSSLIFIYSLLATVWLLASGSAHAQTSEYTLFAVDVSLSADDKDAAFDIITEVTLNTQETRSVGLTLFDDTVRGYIAPAPLDMQHIKALNQTVAGAQDSVRSTSNVAVGIERAIDAFAPQGGADLVVFSRGVIDTETQDPRARFNEWLDLILLPQATQSNIAVTLVVPQKLSTDVQIAQAFEKSDRHQIITIEPGTAIAPELLSLLNIPNRAYGKSDAPVQLAADTTSEPSQAAVNDQPVIDSVKDEPAPADLPMTRMILLALASTLLIGILIWRFFARSTPDTIHDATMPSSTYLPLTEKPSETMDHWMEKETDLRVDKSSGTATDAQSTVARGSDKTVKR